MKRRIASLNTLKDNVIKKDENVGKENIMSQILRDRQDQAVFKTRFGG